MLLFILPIGLKQHKSLSLSHQLQPTQPKITLTILHMAQKAWLILLIILACFKCQAQDLIIKTNGDSIPCIIKQVAPLFIAYKQVVNNKMVSATIPTLDVKSYHYGVLKSDSDWVVQDQKQSQKNNTKGLHIYGAYGMGMLAPPEQAIADPIYDDYLTELRSGTAYQLGVAYFPFTKFGFGLHYSRFNTANVIEKAYIIVNNDTLVGRFSDDIVLHYIAPSFYALFQSSTQPVSLSLNAGVGYAKVTNNYYVVTPYREQSKNIAGHIYAAGEINASKQLSVMVGVGLVHAKFKTATFTDVSKNFSAKVEYRTPVNYSRYDLFVGIRYKLIK